MSAKLGVGVTHCSWIPERVAELESLRPRLEREGLPYVVASVRAPHPNQSVWEAQRLLLERAEGEGWTHMLILGEDMRPAVGAGAVLEMVVGMYPERVWAPFNMSKKTAGLAMAAGVHWASGFYHWGCCMVLPVDYMRAWLSWSDKAFGADGLLFTEDERLAAFMTYAGDPTWAPFPCLFQHEMPNESVFGTSSKLKVASHFLEDVRALDWSSGLAETPIRLVTARGRTALKWLKEQGS